MNVLSGNHKVTEAIPAGVIVAANDDAVLNSSLLASPDLGGGVEVSVQRGAISTGVAYNRGIAATQAEILVFAHQDLYLPEGWMQQLAAAVEYLRANQINWGVLGLFGVDAAGQGRGHVYSTGLRAVLGEAFAGVKPVETLDEVLLVVRRSSGLRFDEALPGFHLYGTDICLQAEARGMSCHAISAFAVHNSNGIAKLPAAYWAAYGYMRRKWSRRLPVQSPCMLLTRAGLPMWAYFLRHTLRRLRGAPAPGRRVTDPAVLWRELRDQGFKPGRR